MTKVKVSVIIPVYNVESFLRPCLDSIINQTLKEIEIICIDDGSKDNSLEILQEYAKKDERFKIIHQENAGAGAARNVGLDNAQGEYISFIDADDWVKHKLYKRLYSVAKEEDLDIVMFKMINYDHEQNKLYETGYYNLSQLKKWFDGSIFNEKNTKNKIFSMSVSPGGKLYKRNLIESINARYPEGMIFEDTPFFMEVYLNAKRSKILNEYFYFRRRTEKSVTTQFDKRYLDHIPMTNILIDIFKKYDKFEFYKRGLFNFKVAFIRKKYADIYENREKLFHLIRKDFLKLKETYLKEESLEKFFYPYNYAFFSQITENSDFGMFELMNKANLLEIENKKLEKELKKCNNFKSKQPIKTLIKLRNKFRY